MDIPEDFSSLVNPFNNGEDLFQKDYNGYESIIKEEQKIRKQYKAELKALKVYSKPIEPDSYVKDVASWTYGISGVIVAAIFLLHIIVWILKLVFNIGWDSWGFTKTVFWWGISLSSAATLITFIVYKIQLYNYESDLRLYENYIDEKGRINSAISAAERKITSCNKEKSRIIQVRKDVLIHCIRTVLGLPIMYDGNMSDSEYTSIRQLYFEMFALKNDINTADTNEDSNSRTEKYLNEKLLFFYNVSMRKGIKNDDIYSKMANQVTLYGRCANANILRQESNIMSKNINESFSTIEYDKNFLLSKKDPLKKYVYKFKDLLFNTDTKGILGFTSKSKQIERNAELHDIVVSAQNEYNKLKPIADNLDFLLNNLRACAYRNLYLGVELINYYRKNAGGSTLSIEHDEIMIQKKGGYYNQYHAENTSGLDVIFGGLDKIDKLMDSSQLLGSAAFVAGVAFAPLALLGNHIDNVSKNEKDAHDMQAKLERTAKDYIDKTGEMLRSIEIVEAIYKANQGFMTIYEPLREKVFVQHKIEDVSQMNIIELATAIKQYKKISDSKIA